MQDIRKWFVKPHVKPNAAALKSEKDESPVGNPSSINVQSDKVMLDDQESSGRRKTSKYFSANKQKEKDETEVIPSTKKSQRGAAETPVKKLQKVIVDDNDDDFVIPTSAKNTVAATPRKRLKNGSGRGISQKVVDIDEMDVHELEDEVVDSQIPAKRKGRLGRGSVDMDEEKNVEKDIESPVKPAGRGRGGRGGRGGRSTSAAATDMDDENTVDKDTESPVKSGGRGRGGRGVSIAPVAGRGRGGGRGGFTNFGERKDPPHKGEKEVPEGAPDCLGGLTFVISGTLDSLEREEAEDLIKRHGGRVTGSVSKKTTYLLCDEDIEGRKSAKAKELGTKFVSEDGLFDMIRVSARIKPTVLGKSKETEAVAALPKKSPQKSELKKDPISNTSVKRLAPKALTSGASAASKKNQNMDLATTWTEKYKPKVPNDIIGNQSLVKQLHDWLTHWNENFGNSGKKEKGKKLNDSGTKKAVLLSGTPGIGKTTSAKLVSQMLGFQTIEVNASDSRGKADSHINRGVGGSMANSVKELVSNESLDVKKEWVKNPKTVLIMDEVDGMSAGDRGGVADLIASIKISKVPIICICNDRYSQKLKSLINYCLLLNFRKPTKQQMGKRLSQVANSEGLKVNEIALEELAERVNGDMRMALNQLQYMSLSMSVINYDDIRKRLLNSSKDEDISPFTAVSKLFGFNGGKLRMDERVDLCMSDPDLVPLLVQENYVNYRPSLSGKDDNGMKRMNMIARAAESIGDGDIVNVQIRRYRQWQLSQTSSLTSCIIPAALLHGQREILEQGERNFDRFGGWLGKNSTMGKNFRLLEDVHYHILASSASNIGRDTLRIDYLTALLKRLTNPLRQLPKDEAVQKSIEFMNLYSISLEDFDTIMELLKFKGHPNPMEGIETSVKSALTKAYKKSTSRIRAADLITLPGIKKAPKKRIAAMLEPASDSLKEENADTLVDSEEEDPSDTENLGGDANGDKKLQLDLQGLNSKGIQVQLELKGTVNSSAKKSSAGRGKGSSTGAAAKKSGQGRGSGSAAAKRKR